MSLPTSKKLKTYLSLSVGATAVGGAAVAEAELLVWNGSPITVSPVSGPRNIKWSVDTMTASTSLQRYNTVTTDFFMCYQRANYVYMNNAGTNQKAITSDVKAFARLSAGDTVGPTTNWGTPTWTYLNDDRAGGWTYSAAHPWVTGADDTQGFIAFALVQGADRNYGWAQFTYDNGPTQSLTLTNFAYETTPNTPITIQSVPEPTTLGLMVSGAVGIAALRRQRKHQAV